MLHHNIFFPLNITARTHSFKTSLLQAAGGITSDLLFFIVVQEEEIPELEIDIDELLELTDEGQRSRLQVSSIKNHRSINLVQYTQVNLSISFFHPTFSHCAA